MKLSRKTRAHENCGQLRNCACRDVYACNPRLSSSRVLLSISIGPLGKQDKTGRARLVLPRLGVAGKGGQPIRSTFCHRHESKTRSIAMEGAPPGSGGAEEETHVKIVSDSLSPPHNSECRDPLLVSGENKLETISTRHLLTILSSTLFSSRSGSWEQQLRWSR